MAGWMALGTAAAGLVGDMMSQSGQQQTNAMNMQLAQQQMQFQEKMSDTAVQRRKADLLAAGINPLLAAGDPASSPTGSLATMQNPNAAFGNMGGQAASAVQAYQQGQQVQSGVSLNSALAAKANADAQFSLAQAVKTAGPDTDVAKESVVSQRVQQVLNQSLSAKANADAQLSTQQASVAQATLPKIQAEIQAIGASRSLDEARTHLTNIQSVAGQLSNAQFQSISPSLIQSAANAAVQSRYDLSKMELSFPQQRADSAMWQSNPGLSYVNAVMNWFHIGANIGGH